MKPAEELSHYLETLSLRVKAAGQSTSTSLGFSELQVVAFVSRKGSCRMTEIAAALGLKLSNLTGIVDKLIERELAVRERSEQDRRVVSMSLTPAGYEIAKVNLSGKVVLAKNMLAQFDSSESAQFMSLMRKMIKGLDK